jgi:hypothetical protein
MARLPEGFMRAYDSQGVSAPGALLYVYTAGTTTPVTTFSNIGMTVANTHPVVADASGAFAGIFFPSGVFKVRVTSAAGVELPGSPSDNIDITATNLSVATIAAAQLATIYPTLLVSVRGQIAEGVGPADYLYSATEPSHVAKFQDAGGYWYGLNDAVPTPYPFGARWDDTTDDTAAIQAWADYLRATRKEGRMDGGFAFHLNTVYLGSITIRGAGGTTNSLSASSKTVLKSPANPRISMSDSATSAQNFFMTHWEGFTSALGTGTVAQIELWDYLEYPYQVGFWIGRNHNFMQRTTDTIPEASEVGGAGGLTMKDMSVEDASGWGVYAYKLWGKSLIHNVFTRRCGGTAAFALSNDRFGGAYNFASQCVDFRVGVIHSFNAGYANSDHDYRGTGIRIGGYKTVVEGLNRLAHNGTNQLFDAIHMERHRNPLEINNTGDVQIGGGSISGPPASHGTYGQVIIGHGSNRGNDIGGSIGPLKCFNIDRVFVMQPGFDLGGLINRQTSLEMQIHSWVGVKWSSTGADSSGLGSAGQNVKLVPRYIPSEMPGGIGSRGAFQVQPFFNTNFTPGSEGANLLRRFGQRSGGTLENWVKVGATGTVGLQSAGAVTLVDSAQVYFDVVDVTAERLVAGQIMTLQVWAELAGTNRLSNLTFGLADLTGTEIVSWPMGDATDLDANTMHQRSVSCVVPTVTNGSGHTGVRVFLKNTATNIVRFRHPILVPGTLRSLGQAPLSVWHSFDGPLTVSSAPAPELVIRTVAGDSTVSPIYEGMLVLSTSAGTGLDGSNGAGLYYRLSGAWVYIGG